MDFEKLIKKRASIKNYYQKKIRMEWAIEAIQAANLAPSPGNLPLLKFIIMQDYEKIKAIAQACRQSFISQAPVLVVVCSDSKNAEIMYGQRAEKYIRQHAGAAIENFLLKITNMGLASCWIGAFSDETVRNILEIPESIEIEAIFPIAYPSKIHPVEQRKKSSLENRIFFNTWKNKFLKPEKKIGGH